MNRTTVQNRDELVAMMQRGYRPQWLHFWGHTPARKEAVTQACFSQWWSGHPFLEEGIRYLTAEHYMMAGKARLFQDHGTLNRILAAASPAEAKKLGRQVQGFEDDVWNANRWRIVVQGNVVKFGQHANLKAFLLQTGEKVLVEASPFDRIWGIGMAADHPHAKNPIQWKGLNLLGFALMEARERLRMLQS